MALGTITKSDIQGWDSIEDIAETLEKRGFERTELGDENEIVMEIDDDEFLAIVASGPDETASDYRSEMNARRHTQIVSTEDFREFTFTTRRRSWDKHGRIKYQRYKIEKSMFEQGGEGRSALDKLNELEYGKPETINQLYDTKKVVSEFYDQFEDIRAKMVRNVANVPDDAGEAKQNYAQTIFDRLIFLHFIQEKKLLDYKQDYLERHHNDIINNNGDVYEEFYKPLFFDWLSSDNGHGRGTLPYLNGGLFTRTEVEKEHEDIRLGETTEETNELFTEILEFLGDWNWHADERLDIVDPNRLSPELLGHIFEKTVNQKEMGAYYTPEEITHFMARNTIHPYIIDRINEKFDTDYEEIDDIFAVEEDTEEQEGETTVIGGLEDIDQDEITYLYFDVLQDLKVLDPAVGSGAFLLAAEEVLLDIYLSCITYFRRLSDERSYEMTRKITDFLEELDAQAANASMHAKRQIILNNLYGVDIDKGATEICKLRLWLSIVADLEKGDDPHDVEALPNIDFNIRQGNSLIGFTEPVEKAMNDDIDDDKDQAKLTQYEPEAIKDKYQELIKLINTYKAHEQAGEDDKAEQAKKEAQQRLEEYREKPDKKILQQFHEAGIGDVDLEDVREFSPFHWVLEFAGVYSEGGFDVVIGNPPWDRLKPLRDDFFSKYDEVFRTRMPDDKDEKQEELLEDDKIAREWEEYQKEMERRAEYFKENPTYNLQKPEIDGKVKPNPNDLSALFLERVFDLAKDDSYVSQILPALIFNSALGKDLRMHLLNNTRMETLAVFENRGIFDDLHYQYNFGIVTFRNSGYTDNVLGTFSVGDLSPLTVIDEEAIQVPREVLEQYSPKARLFPTIESKEQINLIRKVTDHPSVGDPSEGSWYMHPYQGLRRTSDADRFVEEEKGDYPVYGGKNIHQFIYNSDILDDIAPPEFWSVEETSNPEKSAKQRLKEKRIGKLKSSIYEAFDGEESQKSQKQFVNDLLNRKRDRPLELDDVLLDCSDYRIVYRDIARSTDERTLIAAVIPKGVVCHNKLRTIDLYDIEPYEEGLSEYPLHNFYEKIFTDKELFAALGIVNSLPFDFLIRTKVDNTVANYKFKETQAPSLKEGDDWFNHVWRRAARLNCYGSDFSDMRERLGGIDPVNDREKRQELRAELEAGVFHAYGLSREETKYVMDKFHKVENPRMMTDDYFDMVLEKYEELAEKGPMD